MEVAKETGTPLLEGWSNGLDLPHTVTTAVTYRLRINSLNELPKDKRPPRNLWDKPWRLDKFLEAIFEKGGKNDSDSSTTSSHFINLNDEDVE